MARLFWLIPLIPGASALILLLFGSRLSRKWISWQACAAVLLPFVLSCAGLLSLVQAGPGSPGLAKTLLPWIASGAFAANVSFVFDELAAVMALVVTGVGLLIHIYSVGYMAEDKAYARYFAFLNLFTFFMLVLVLASDIVLMFVGWEGVGLCSYLLIGFWFEPPGGVQGRHEGVRRQPDRRRGFHRRHPLPPPERRQLELRRDQRRSCGRPFRRPAWRRSWPSFSSPGRRGNRPRSPSTSGCPTPWKARRRSRPSSTRRRWSRPASIWSRRLSGLFAASPTASAVVAWTGGLTAVFAATIALVQTDIKRVLAYSTISQIGYMFIGCGVGAYAAGMFHLVTHAFFKSLLFLAAGSVIHALGGEQDMRRMGGLKRHLPLTFPVFLVGALAISGVPFLVRLLLEGRHPDQRLRRRSLRPLRPRPRRGGPDGVLHVPARVPDILRGAARA